MDRCIGAIRKERDMQFTDLETWMLDNADMRIFRVWKYKKVFTPLEQDRKYIDQSPYEEDVAKLVWLEEVIEFDNGRIMFGFKNAETAALYEIGESSVPASIEYMMDGEFSMEYWGNDKKRLFEELGLLDDEDTNESEPDEADDEGLPKEKRTNFFG